jgi:hypothetical protein
MPWLIFNRCGPKVDCSADTADELVLSYGTDCVSIISSQTGGRWSDAKCAFGATIVDIKTNLISFGVASI